MPSMTVILLSSEENEFSLLCFHILIYCLTTGKSGAENSALLVETCEQSPCRKLQGLYQAQLLSNQIWVLLMHGYLIPVPHRQAPQTRMMKWIQVWE